MDNQQIRQADTGKELAARCWLAGTVDADGCIHMTTRERRGYISHTPNIDIASVCPATIEVLVKTINMLGTGGNVNRINGGCQAIRVAGIKRCRTILSKITPFMVTKQEEAILMLEWCNSRLEKSGFLTFQAGNSCQSGNKRAKDAAYSEYENSLMVAIKQLKSARNLRDYMPNPWWLSQGEDIVRTQEETLETQAEMTCAQA